MTAVVALTAGLFIGLCLGLLGGGGSILAVPVLVYLLDQTPLVASTGALVIVGLSAFTGAVAAWRRGRVHPARGLAFAAVGTVGAALGATLSLRVRPDLMLAGFSVLMALVAVAMLLRQVKGSATEDVGRLADQPIVVLRPDFRCNCPRAVRVLVTALVVGMLTGLFGVGGGFLVVPALVLALDLTVPMAVGTSLLVIAINSAVAFWVRLGSGVQVEWGPVAMLSAAAMASSLIGVALATRIDPRALALGFVVLLLLTAGYTAVDGFGSLVLQ